MLGENLVYFHANKHHKLIESKGKHIYSVLLRDKATVRDQTQFNEEYDIEPCYWEQLYMLPKKVLVDERTREFQYKILQNIYVQMYNFIK